MLRQDDSAAAKVLLSLGVDLARARSAVEFILGHGTKHVVNELGLTPRAKRVVELAVDESRRLGHHFVGTEHLLLGLIREGEGIAAGVLESLGVSLERARAEVINVMTVAGEPPTPPAERQANPYLLLRVEWRHDTPVVIGVIDQEAENPLGAAELPLPRALGELHDKGWHLVGVDSSAPNGSLYLFRRPD